MIGRSVFTLFLAAAIPAAAEADWQSSVTRAIADGEYHLSLNEPTGAFTAPNRAHDFRPRWSPDGAFSLESRTDAKAWSFSYRLLGVGRDTTRVVSAVRRESATDGRIEWQRDGIREWYVNDTRGIEQGFVLESRPGGDGRHPVIIEGAIDGLLAYPAADGQSVLFRTPQGRDAMRISDLSVVDAEGKSVTACFEVGVGAISIVVDDRAAVYPLTVHRQMTSPAWTAESNQTGANFGNSVSTAGDVNGDGYSDVIVGAYRYDNGDADEGAAFLYLGSASGLATTAAWRAESNQASALFGGSVATAGDVNGDGFADVLVGASYYDNGQGDEGRTFVYLGSAAGLAATAAWTGEGNQPGATFGYSVATAGDVNGDGFSDVVVGSPLHDSGEKDEGLAFLYLGSVSGLAATAVWTTESDQESARLGWSVATAGDVDGDGYTDVIVGAPRYDNPEVDEGHAFVYRGSPSGPARTAAWTVGSNQPSAEFGLSVATAGDVNGDGYADAIVGASLFDNGEGDEGRAFVYLGSASGLDAIAAWTAESDQAGAAFAQSVAPAGDTNGDGYADVMVGAPMYDNGEMCEGRAFVYLGSASGPSTTAAWTTESDQALSALGGAVATAGDINADGYSDLLVGAALDDHGERDEGRVLVYLGSASGVATTPAWTANPNQTETYFGDSVATAGDVNGDGYSDVIVGAPLFDNGDFGEGRADVFLGSAIGLSTTAAWSAEGNQDYTGFGHAVATAGDVNGDGYSDVIIGAWNYRNGLSNGRAFVYLGSAAGLAATPAWTAEGNLRQEHFGFSVATAGDVNGDGYSDVIVGAPGDSGPAGARAFVYLGSASGVAATPAWIAGAYLINPRFGWSVATAGDVNGDGFSDVVVGANLSANGEPDEGAAFVYLGSASGLAATPAWTAEGDQVAAQFGTSVATAGDINGDGFSDLIVGAWRYDNGEMNEGRAFVYAGSASGLAATPTWTAESNQAGAEFGRSVATAGDVNGDGFSDVIVGAWHYDSLYETGRAFVFLGSASGLTATSPWTADGDDWVAWFGSSVATAGDVNGDGYSDVLIGTPYYDRVVPDGGAAFLYYGNSGDGLDRTSRQARGDGSAPIDLLGGTLSTDGFRLRANGRSPFGRDHVRLEWEVKPVATPFDGTDIRTSNWFDTGAPGASGSVVPLDELHTPLLGPGPFHWRLRLRSRSPFPWQSHWMSLPYNAITETDLRTENNVARCDLAYADLTFPPLTPAKVAPWVYTLSCAAGDVLPTLLRPSIVSGTDIDTLGGSPGTLRFYLLSCGCADGIWLTKRMGSVNLSTF